MILKRAIADNAPLSADSLLPQLWLLVTVLSTAVLPSALLFTPSYGRSIGISDYSNSMIAAYTSTLDFICRRGSIIFKCLC